jgi:hypothetical protein
MGAIAVASLIAAVIWISVRFLVPPLQGMDELAGRMVFALKCCCVALLFTLVTGVEAVAHERLQTPAFDPLAGYRSRRLEVNHRYLQNTLEQFLVFTVGLFGLALYSPGGSAMRAVLATAVVWVLARFAFWAGYHRSAAMRGLGAPGMMISMLVLLYVVSRISYDAAGTSGVVMVLGGFLAFEILLFRKTRAVPDTSVSSPGHGHGVGD